MEYKYKNGDRVSAKLAHDFVVEGTICGVAQIPYPKIGANYIIRLDQQLPDHPYDCIPAFESQLTLIVS